MNVYALPFKKMVASFMSRTTNKVDLNEFILYKIVDSYTKGQVEYFKMQCINTKAVFDALIQDIVFDEDILYGLHPIQGCYIGIEYEKTTKFDNRNSNAQVKPRNVFSKYSASRYGNNHLLYQNRKGLLGFESKITGEQFLMDPRDIALSRSLIEEFDAVQAFCIGVLAGLKFANPKIEENALPKTKEPHLRLVEK